MTRMARGQKSAGYVYHVINRGNGGATVFHKDGDYRAFLDLLAIAKTKYPIKVFGFCLMPNHFHLVLEPSNRDTLSRVMLWWLTSHVRRYHRHYHSHGHVWQGRYKNFPIQQDGHLLTVLHYVVNNPVRAGLAPSAEQWPWSSLRHPALLDPWPLEVPPTWPRACDDPLADHDLAQIRTCVNRQAPFGSPTWQERLAQLFGLESTLRPRGRPRNTPKK
jgi:putative transposase